MAGAPMGEIIYSAVKPVIRMYMIIGTGFFLTRKGLFGVTAARACSDMVLMLFMPALVFDKIVSYISISDIKTIGVICFCAFVMYSINAVVAFLIVRFTPVPKSREERWVGGGLLAGIMQNVSDLPISYIQAVSIFSTKQQNKGTAYVIIWLAMYVVTQFNCGLFQLVNWDFEYMGQTSGDAEKGDQLSHSCSETVQSDQSEKFREENDDDDVHDQNNLTSSTKTSLNSSDNEDLQQPVNNNQASMERPMSEVSSLNISIDSETGIGQPTHGSTSAAHRIQSHPSVRTRASSKQFSENYDPRPLTAVNSRISHLARTLSKGSAIARIPSARSINTNGPNDSDHEDMLSLNQELIREYSRVQPYNQKMSKTMKVVTETNLTSQDVKESGEEIPFIKKYHLHYVVFFLENFKKPMSVSLILAIIIALIPWTKALFVNDGKVTLKNAPDKQPALSFILMYAEYLGAPCVPLGLLLIGSVLARLDVSVLPKGFWKSAVCHTVFRLGVLPIIGMAFITRLKTIGWLTDPMAIFVCVMEFALPSATVQIYLTAGAMRPEDKTSTPLNCFGLYLILQYAVLVISMPIVVCYCIKHPMGL